jgi:hypothetical protein
MYDNLNYPRPPYREPEGSLDVPLDVYTRARATPLPPKGGVQLSIPPKFSFFYKHLRSHRPVALRRTRAIHARADEGGVRGLANGWAMPPRHPGPGYSGSAPSRLQPRLGPANG